MADWSKHKYQAGPATADLDDAPKDTSPHARKIEPWLSAALQSEHLSLLLGSGFTSSIAALADAKAAGMAPTTLPGRLGRKIQAHAEKSAADMGRGSANIEDQMRVAMAVLQALEITGPASVATSLKKTITTQFEHFLQAVLETERNILDGMDWQRIADGTSLAHGCLVSFLMTFASRSASRERLNLFTTNYDRLLEYGCDQAGIRIIDRFVGTVEPVFRSSRLDVDMHYNPPGIRGEPRFLEGVIRYSKLHGSLDWSFEDRRLRRIPIPFGAPADHTGLPGDPVSTVMIYPNAAKDIETAAFPYAEIFRDFSAGLCRPNSTLFTYGYGFGDDHVNRVIADMLTLPSTHLVVMSWDSANGRIQRFLENNARPAQYTLLIGNHFGDLRTLVEDYLPKPAIDTITGRMAGLLRQRGIDNRPGPADGEPGSGDAGVDAPQDP